MENTQFRKGVCLLSGTTWFLSIIQVDSTRLLIREGVSYGVGHTASPYNALKGEVKP